MRIRRVITLLAITALLTLVVKVLLSEDLLGKSPSKEGEKIEGLSTTEIEKRLEEIDRQIADLEMESDYIKTEPPDYGYDSGEIERTGYPQRRVRSELLHPWGEENIAKKLEGLRRLKSRLEKELDKRYSSDWQIGEE